MLVDGNRLPRWRWRAQAIVDGDALHPCISAASIIAKEHRDRLPFANGVFDLVWATLPREQLKPARGVLRQALRVLRPGGQLLITAPLVATFAELCAAMSPALVESTTSGVSA